MGEKRIHVGYWWESQKGESSQERPRRGWVDNIKIELREIEWGFMDWIDLAQDRYQWRAHVNMVINLSVP
jgi:hypothetical protein